MAKHLTIQDFFKQFPDNDACLAHLFKMRYGDDFGCPKCGEIGKFRKLAKHPAYTCNCGHHVHPMKGTIFTDSHTPLTKWFYAVYLFTTTRHGVPAKELERQLGVSYPTAFRMAHLIRLHMGKTDGDKPLSGHVEADEAYIGGVRPGPRGRAALGKTIVFGMLQRHGDVMTKVVPNTTHETLFAHIEANVEKPSLISTDENSAYKGLDKQGYVHRSVNHSAKEYVRGDTHTNGLEGFWAMIKRSIRGTHIHVSRKHLSKYLGEFEYRYNMRHSPELMFARLVLSF